MRIQSSASRSSLDEIVLFPFDDYAFPLQRGVELHLNSHRATCRRTQIVLPVRPPGVRIASWERDRRGSFQAYLGGPFAKTGEDDPHIISAPIDLEGKVARLFLNIDCVNEFSNVSVEILDERLNPLPGYWRDLCNAPTEDGFKQLVTWGGKDAISSLESRIRVRVDFTGIRFEDVRLYAIYLNEVT